MISNIINPAITLLVAMFWQSKETIEIHVSTGVWPVVNQRFVVYYQIHYSD